MVQAWPSPAMVPLCSWPTCSRSTVSVIATATNTVVDTLPTAVAGVEPTGLVVSPDNTRLYIARSGSGLVREIDMATRTYMRTVSLGVNGIGGMGVAPDGSRLYVSNLSTHSVKVIDTSTFTVVATIPLGAGTFPGKLAVSPNGLLIYVALLSNSVAVVDATANTLLTNVNVGQFPQGVAVAPTGDYAFATSLDNVNSTGTVSRINTATQTVTGSVPSVRGLSVAFAADGGTAWVVGIDSVYAISTATNSVVGTPIPLTLAVDGLGWEIVTTPPPFTPPLAITTTTLPTTAVGAAYSASLAATGGAGAITWAIDSGALPAGLTLSPAGTIAGTSTVAGTATFTVRATDAASATTTRYVVHRRDWPLRESRARAGAGSRESPEPDAGVDAAARRGRRQRHIAIVASLAAGGPIVAQLPVGTADVLYRGRAGRHLLHQSVCDGDRRARLTSNEIRVDIAPPALPLPPQNLMAAVAGSIITFAWQAPSGSAVTGYVLEAGSGPGLSNLAILPLGDVTTFVTPPVPNGSYYVRVRGQNTSGTGPPSNEVRIVVGPPPPSAPTLTGSGSVGGNVVLSWSTPSSGAAVAGYELHAGTAPGLSNIVVIPLPASQEMLGAGGVPPGTYYVRVVATSAQGPGEMSNEIALVVP